MTPWKTPSNPHEISIKHRIPEANGATFPRFKCGCWLHLRPAVGEWIDHAWNDPWIFSKGWHQYFELKNQRSEYTKLILSNIIKFWNFIKLSIALGENNGRQCQIYKVHHGVHLPMERLQEIAGWTWTAAEPGGDWGKMTVLFFVGRFSCWTIFFVG